VDTNPRVVETINRGNIHIVEPDLDILVKSAVHSGNLTASSKPEEADVFIIAVPTPFRDNKKPDLTYVETATESIIPVLKKGNLVILESTSPVGTTESRVSAIIKKQLGWKPGEDFFVAHCPERVLPGRILKELVDNDRIIGGINRASAEAARALYSTFVIGNIFLTDCNTAEMAKLVENAYRDVNIAFANELSLICDYLGIRVWEVIELANKHPRVNILQPGPGVGGHCIAVDPWFIVDSAPAQSRLIRTAREVNDSKPHFVIEKVKKQALKFKAPVIGCLGLTYKNDVDDLRESPAMDITRELIREKIGKILVCEPYVKDFKEFELHPLDTVLKESDIIVLLVNHKQFYDVDRELLKEKIVIDTRGIWR
jgi:UDP-N-acetyl-D-mannosaminuronic acid dehydrogenase